MRNTPIAILIDPANNPRTSEDTNTVVTTRTTPSEEADLIAIRSDKGKTRNSAPVPMSVQPSIFLKPSRRFNLLKTRGITVSKEKMKIKSGTTL